MIIFAVLMVYFDLNDSVPMAIGIRRASLASLTALVVSLTQRIAMFSPCGLWLVMPTDMRSS